MKAAFGAEFEGPGTETGGGRTVPSAPPLTRNSLFAVFGASCKIGFVVLLAIIACETSVGKAVGCVAR
jgi:hypothetical protein